MRFPKLLCLVCGALAGAVYAAPLLECINLRVNEGAVELDRQSEVVFAEDFSEGLKDWSIDNYSDRLVIETRTVEGEIAAYVGMDLQPDGKWTLNGKPIPLDTAWELAGRPFDVVGGADFMLKIRLCTTINRLVYVAGHADSYKMLIRWYGVDGKTLVDFPYRFDNCKPQWTDHVFNGVVPKEAVSGRFFIGFDMPNVSYQGFVALSKVIVSQYSSGQSRCQSGSFVSLPFHADGTVEFSWEADCPPECGLRFQISTASDEEGLPGAWSDFADHPGGKIVLPEGHAWLRYLAVLGGDGAATPRLKAVHLGDRMDNVWSINLDKAPGLVPLSDSPSPDPGAEIRFQVTADSTVAWDRVRFTLDGNDVTAQVVRNGAFASYRPPEPLKPVDDTNAHQFAVTGCDVLGRAFQDSFIFLCGELLTKNLVTLRDDGFVLIDGKPFFPIGLYAVWKREFNDFSLDKAFHDLKEAGFNFAHTYNITRGPEFSEFLDTAARYGFKLWISPGEEQVANVVRERRHPAVLAWYLGDDTHGHIHEDAVRRNHDICHALDNAHLTTQADFLVGQDPSCYGPYVHSTDAFLPEIYPMHEATPSPADVPSVIRDMKTIYRDLALNGSPVKSIWAILQHFDGWGFQRFPTFDELRAMSYLAIIHGAHGVTWYTYGGYNENHGVTSTPEHWREICTVAGELAAIQERLCAQNAKSQPTAEILEGPAKDALGYPSISLLLKDNNGAKLLLAANSSTEAVKAAIAVKGYRQARTLFENRTIECAELLTDDFAPFAVHVYELAP